MSNALPDPAPGPGASRALDIRSLGRRARAHQISGNALMGLGLGLAVLAAGLLLWAGIVTGWARVVLLAAAAILIPARLIASRLSGLTLGDGLQSPTNSGLRRWLSHGEAAALLTAGGLNAFGSGHDVGAALGPGCAALLLLGRLRAGAAGGYLFGLTPTLVLAAAAIVAAFEPLWGWRGQTFLVALSAISAVLVVPLLRPRRSPPSAASLRDRPSA